MAHNEKLNNADLRAFGKEQRRLIDDMQAVGWRGRLTDKGALMYAPDGETTLMVGHGTAARGARHALNDRRAFERYERAHEAQRQRQIDPDVGTLLAVAQSLGWNDEIIPNGKVRLRRGKHTVMLDPAGMKRADLHDARQRIVRNGDREAIAAFANEPEAITDVIVEGPQHTTEQVVEHTPSIVRRPWYAAKHSSREGGVRYESPAVVEVVVDGVVTEYECAKSGCGYTHENPRSVATHFGRSKDHGASVTPPPTVIDPTYTEPMSHREYTPTDRLIAALLSEITDERGRLRADLHDPRALAVAMLRWQNERPDLPPGDARPSRPLTNDEIVERLRLLVDRGEDVTARRALDEANERAALADNALAVERAARVKAEQRVETLRSDLAQLSDLIDQAAKTV